jgi:hypothetical protein
MGSVKCYVFYKKMKCLETYKVKTNYRNHRPQIDQDTQNYQCFFLPSQVFARTFGNEQNKERSKVKAKAVSKLGEPYCAMSNQDRQNTDYHESGGFTEFIPRSFENIEESWSGNE